MDELEFDEVGPERRSEEVVPPVPWETHPAAGKHGSEVTELVGGKNSEASDILERSQLRDDDDDVDDVDGERIGVNVLDVTKCGSFDASNSPGTVCSSLTMTSGGFTGKMVHERKDDYSAEAEGEEDFSEVFTADVTGITMEDAKVFHESPKMERPERSESPRWNLKDVSDVVLPAETNTTSAETGVIRVSITLVSSPEMEPTNPIRHHELSVIKRATAASEVADDTSHREVPTSVTSVKSVAEVSNQNSEPNQNIFVASPIDALANDGVKNEDGKNEDRKNEDGKNEDRKNEDRKNEDELNRNFEVKGSHRKSRTTDDLPTGGSKSKSRRVGHLVLDELTPTNARRSYRSKRKHLNSSSSGKHGDPRRRGDNRTICVEELSESNPSNVERKHQSEVLDSVTEDAIRFIPSSGDWHEVNSEGECRDAVVRKSSYLRAVKVSASQIGDAKVHRSTSYRIATARHQVATAGEADQPRDADVEGDSHSKADHPPSRSTRADQRAASSHTSREATEACHSDEGARKARSDRRGSSHRVSVDHGRRLSLAKDLLLLSPTAISAAQSWTEAGAIALAGATEIATTPTKASGIRRLKELFMEKSSPKDGSNVDHPHFVYDDRPDVMSSSGSVDGQLNCKNTMMDGKRSTDRAWKCIHAVLRGHHLYLHPDKATQSVLVYEHPISVKNALVDIAYDYVKRKNVFRLTTYNISEFLLEASDQENMLHWIRAIQECGYLISDKEFSASRELIRQKRLMSRQASRSGAHDSSSHRKHSDSSRSPRLASKIPEPVGLPRTRKTSREPSKSPQRESQATDEDAPKSPQRKSAATVLRHADNSDQKSKDVRTWKSKMVKKFKRLSSQSPASSNVDQIGAFGVELNRCVPSPNNEFVPLIVDACITIVESKGLTNKGIYRVPGNSAAITQLQAELNRDPTSINLESEKWQDVNAVISLLKLFFRELPDPLITKELYSSMIEANRVDDATKRMLKIKRLIHHLPMHNFETFHFLACHLNKVSSAGDINMMDARNLAIVFGPTLLQPKQDMLNMVKDMSDQCRIVESIILHCEWFFSSWDEDVNVPADGEKDSSMVPITGMDQQLIAKAEHMVLEEQTQGSKKLWRPNTNRKPNPKDRCTTSSVIGLLDSNNERNIDEEIMSRSGLVAGEKTPPAAKTDVKTAKTRAKSVPPRPVSTLQVQPGKPVERMVETAPAKRKNSSPVTFQRRESAIPGGRGTTMTRREFHRSSSEASEKTYGVSSSVNTRGKQFGGVMTTRATQLEQHANNRKSLSTHALYGSKLAQGHKLSPVSTPRGSEEKLGSPHSSRSSRSTIVGETGEGKRRKASQQHVVRPEGSGRGGNSKSAVGPQKPDGPSRKEGHSEAVGLDATGLTVEDENLKMRQNLETSKKDVCLSDGDKSWEPTGVRILEESCLVLRQADSRRVWNATNQKWEDVLPKNVVGSSPSPKRSPVKSNVENNQMSDVSSTRLNDDDASRDKSTTTILNADGVSFLAEKSNVSPRLGGRQKAEDVTEITELSLEHKVVVCEDKENHIDVIFTDDPDNSVVRLSPVCQSHRKPDVHDASVSPGKASLSPDPSFPSPGGDVVQPTPPTTRVVMRRSHHPDDSVKSEPRREPHSRSHLLTSPNTDQPAEQQKDSQRRLMLDGANDGELESVVGVVVESDSTSKALHRTSSEPNLRVSSPVAPPQLKGSPKKETRPKAGRSFSASNRSHHITSHHHHNTLPASARLRGRLPKGSSRSPLTYESSV